MEDEARVRDEQRAHALEDKLRADPDDEATVLELCDVLGRLGRDMDLFAVLSARLEDASDATRKVLLPRHVAVLERLRAQAIREGRDEEAALYADALAALRPATEAPGAPSPRAGR